MTEMKKELQQINSKLETVFNDIEMLKKNTGSLSKQTSKVDI